MRMRVCTCMCMCTRMQHLGYARAEQVDAQRVERGHCRPHAQVELVAVVGHDVHRVLLQDPAALGDTPEEPRRGRLVARHVALAEGVHVDADLVEATERLEDPDAVRLGLLALQV